MQTYLRELNVPSVVYSNASVFSSDEAGGRLERCFSPSVIRLMMDWHGGLATSMMGVTGDELSAMIEDEAAWERWLAKFEEYRDAWQHEGFIAMARMLVAREKIKQRMRTHADGDRRLTNLLHCLELLHRVSTEEKLGIEDCSVVLGETTRYGRGRGGRTSDTPGDG
jgi:exodeoxyribonuclease V beta subunit